MTKFKNAEHLLRLAGAATAALLIFLALRAYFIPPTFGQYGHYRGAALEEVASHPVVYAGHKACEDCHAAEFELKRSGKHAGVNCEACHGPLAKHAEDPAAVVPQLPDSKQLCARCHNQEQARPAKFPQVKVEDHAGDLACTTCHKPHSPSMKAPEKKS